MFTSVVGLQVFTKCNRIVYKQNLKLLLLLSEFDINGCCERFPILLYRCGG